MFKRLSVSPSSSLGSISEDGEEPIDFPQLPTNLDGVKPEAATENEGWKFPTSCLMSQISSEALASTSGGKQLVLYNADGTFATHSTAVYAVALGFPDKDFKAHNANPGVFPPVFREGKLTIMQWFPNSDTVTFSQTQREGSYSVPHHIKENICKLDDIQRAELTRSLSKIGDLKYSFGDLQMIIDWNTGSVKLIDPQGMARSNSPLRDISPNFKQFCENVSGLFKKV